MIENGVLSRGPLGSAESTFAADVREYLQRTPKQLPSQYLYDPLGSALFDAICELPWYGLTRAEQRLITGHRGDIFEHLSGLSRIVELGPGDGRKLAALVEGTTEPLTAHLVDVSPAALARAAHALSDAAHVHVTTHEGSYEEGLSAVAASYDRTLVAFLGSNVGNFDLVAASALLRRMRRALAPGDGLLVGADLVKPEGRLLLAYDDPLGVSAAFNLNILIRINQELEADFDVRAFHHRAVWNPDASRMEMHLVSDADQLVRIEAIDLDIDLREGEEIWTESSYKYTPEGLACQLENAGFETVEQWMDEEYAFALTLAIAR